MQSWPVFVGGVGILAVLAGAILLISRLRMRERCTGLVVDAWVNPEGGRLPIVSFAAGDGAALKFRGAPYISRFGPKYGGEVPVRYNKNRLEAAARSLDSYPREYLTNPEYIEAARHPPQWQEVRFGAVRIDTFRGTWSGPLGLTTTGLVCLVAVARTIIG